MKRYILILFLFFSPSSLWAYNFLYLNSTTRQPVGWEPGTTIRYYVDPGSLGRLTNEQARTLIRAAMDIWENASPYANVPHFEYAGLLPEDVNGTNYSSYVSATSCNTSDLSTCPSQAQRDLKTVVIFDADGTILSRELCRIRSCGALGGARVFNESGNIVEGILVLGPSTAATTSVINSSVGTIVHEIGHLLGLAHPALNQQLFSNTLLSNDLPTMELQSTSDAFDYTGLETSSLNPDDIAGITAIYPSSTASANLGTIKGTITKSDGTPMSHVNVIARNNSDPLCESYSYLTARSCDYATSSSCELYPDASSYQISNLPAGTYTIEVEEIANASLAAVLAPGLIDPSIYGDAEFWNEDDVAAESPTTSSSITLAAGETRENINIILNRSTVTDDRIKYIPLSSFTAGPGTRCQPNSTNYVTMLGISEPTSSTSSGGCSLLGN